MRQGCAILPVFALSCGLSACDDPVVLPPAPPAATPAPAGVLPRVKNVVLVTIDTLRADYLGAYGGAARTPNMDGLAARGWLFENCISASMLTNPSHASIMTSLYPRDHGVYDNESGIHDGMRTLAAALRKHGLRTGAVVNFPHLNPNVANLGQGFERLIPATRSERRASEVSRLSLLLIDELLSEPGAQGFFVWLHYTDPHAPYDPLPEHPAKKVPGRTSMTRVKKAAPRFQRQNMWFKKALGRHRHAEELVQHYIAEIEATDAGLALLLRGLEERGHQDTAVVVTSDHGENMGERQLYFHHGGLYRPAVHVPLLIAAPGVEPKRFVEQVATVDIAPTVLDLVGAPRWEPMRGHSLFGLVRGSDRGRDFVFSEHMLAQLVSVRSKTGTLILHRKTSRQFPTYPFEAGKRELYDLIHDPDEARPQIATGELANDLETALRRYLGMGLQLTARPSFAQDRVSLRALGYIE